MDSPRLLQVSHEKELLIEKLKYVTSLRRRRKKAKCRLGLRAWRKKPTLCLHEVVDEDGTLWKMKTNRAGGYVNIGVRFLTRVSLAGGTIAMRLSCGMFTRLRTIHVGKLTEMNLMNSWPQ